jgi:hypothetical protein
LRKAQKQKQKQNQTSKESLPSAEPSQESFDDLTLALQDLAEIDKIEAQGRTKGATTPINTVWDSQDSFQDMTFGSQDLAVADMMEAGINGDVKA